MSKSEWCMPAKTRIKIDRWIRKHPVQRMNFQYDDLDSDITIEETVLATYLYDGPINPNNLEKLIAEIRLMVKFYCTLDKLISEGFIEIKNCNEFGDPFIALTDKGVERGMNFRKKIEEISKR